MIFKKLLLLITFFYASMGSIFAASTEQTVKDIGTNKDVTYFFVVPTDKETLLTDQLKGLPSAQRFETLHKAILKADTIVTKNTAKTVRIIVMPGTYDISGCVTDGFGLIVEKGVEIMGSWRYNDLNFALDTPTTLKLNFPGKMIYEEKPDDYLTVVTTKHKGRAFKLRGQAHNIVIRDCHLKKPDTDGRGGGGVLLDGGALINCIVTANAASHKSNAIDNYASSAVYVLRADGHLVPIQTKRDESDMITGITSDLEVLFPVNTPTKRPIAIAFNTDYTSDGELVFTFISTTQVSTQIAQIDNLKETELYKKLGVFNKSIDGVNDHNGKGHTRVLREIHALASSIGGNNIKVIEDLNDTSNFPIKAGTFPLEWFLPSAGQMYQFITQTYEVDYCLKAIKKHYQTQAGEDTDASKKIIVLWHTDYLLSSTKINEKGLSVWAMWLTTAMSNPRLITEPKQMRAMVEISTILNTGITQP